MEPWPIVAVIVLAAFAYGFTASFIDAHLYGPIKRQSHL